MRGGRLSVLDAGRRDFAWIGALVLIAVLAVLLRVWNLDALGFNSDEAVYAGQGASIAGNREFLPYFPVFRAHPLLFQSIVSIPYQWGVSPLIGRLLSAAFGVATVAMTGAVGARLYGRNAGLIAALIIAVMPYHVVVTRQVLLDGPMTFFATTTLYLLVRYSLSQRPVWLYAAGAMLGLTVLAKEPSILLLGGVYAYFAITPTIRVRIRDLVISSLFFVSIIVIYPITISMSGRSSTGHSFLTWQLFRRANHTWLFYPAVVPTAIGLLVLAAAAYGLWRLRTQRSWRELLLLSWIVVPAMFFQLWPTKGFQYLLYAGPPIAVLAGRTLATLPQRPLAIGLRPLWQRLQPLWARLEPLVSRLRPNALRRGAASSADHGQHDRSQTNGYSPQSTVVKVRPATVGRRIPVGIVRIVAVAVVAVSVLIPSWIRIQPASAGATFLAGSGGVPGGREAGHWVAENVPEGAEMLALGPSMANIIQFYGHRKVYGLSVSPNPLHRNPVYEPIHNPDLRLRNNDLQYIVWDAFSAGRSPFFSQRLLQYAERFNGRPVHTQSVTTNGPDGPRKQPVIVIYEVRS